MASTWFSTAVRSLPNADSDYIRAQETPSSVSRRMDFRSSGIDRRAGSALAERTNSGVHGTLRRDLNQQFQRILVAYDGSSPAEHAVEIALALAGSAVSKVLILAVIRPSEPDESVRFQAKVEDTRRCYEESFISLRELARRAGINLETQVVIGTPAEEIVCGAGAMHADLIVMGRHARSAIRRFMLGSSSDRVMRNVECPVMLVR